MHSNAVIAEALSAAFLTGTLDIDALVDRGARLLGSRWRWLRPLARRVCDTFGGRTRPRQTAVANFIFDDGGFSRACRKYDLKLDELLATPPSMSPVTAVSSWGVPSICTAGELADWLGITISDLEWLADLRNLEYKRNHSRASHYHYRPLTKRFGQIRLVEAPKTRLKSVQRRILVGILDHVPPHSAAHGFRRGRSIKTFASPHAGKRVVLRIDFQDFFPSISLARIQALFRTVGYCESVADLLAGLCTNSTPMDVWENLIHSIGRQMCQACWLYSP